MRLITCPLATGVPHSDAELASGFGMDNPIDVAYPHSDGIVRQNRAPG